MNGLKLHFDVPSDATISTSFTTQIVSQSLTLRSYTNYARVLALLQGHSFAGDCLLELYTWMSKVCPGATRH